MGRHDGNQGGWHREWDSFKEIPVSPQEEIAHLRNMVAFLQGMNDQLKRELVHKQELLDTAIHERTKAESQYRRLSNRMQAGEQKARPNPHDGKPHAPGNQQRHRRRGAYAK